MRERQDAVEMGEAVCRCVDTLVHYTSDRNDHDELAVSRGLVGNNVVSTICNFPIAHIKTHPF